MRDVCLRHLDDGESAEWRVSRDIDPIHALDENGKWLGAIMPVRIGSLKPTVTA